MFPDEWSLKIILQHFSQMHLCIYVYFSHSNTQRHVRVKSTNSPQDSFCELNIELLVMLQEECIIRTKYGAKVHQAYWLGGSHTAHTHATVDSGMHTHYWIRAGNVLRSVVVVIASLFNVLSAYTFSKAKGRKIRAY